MAREDAVWGGISALGLQSGKKWLKIHDEGRALKVGGGWRAWYIAPEAPL